MTMNKSDNKPEFKLELEPLDDDQSGLIIAADDRSVVRHTTERRIKQRRVTGERREVFRFSEKGDRRQIKDRRSSVSVWEKGYAV